MHSPSPNSGQSPEFETSASWHRVVTGAVGLIAGVVILLQIHVNFDAYRRHIADTERLTYTLARVVEDQTQRSLQTIFLVLDAIQHDIRFDGSADEARLDYDAARLRIRSVPEIRGFYLVGSNLRVVDSSLSQDDIGLHLGDHDYIRRMESSDVLPYALGSPISRRMLSGAEMPGLAFIPIAIRLPNKGGYLVAVVNVSFLELQYRALLSANGAAVTLLRFDGTVLMDAERAWAGGQNVGKSDPMFVHHLPDVEAATFHRPAMSGKKDQVVSFRVTRTFPVVVAVGIELSQIRNAWLRSALPTLIPTIIAVALVLVALWHLARQFGYIVRQEAALRASRDVAEAASKAKSQFLAVMSHEIRTPMTAVLGMSSALLDERLEPDQRSSVEAIHQAGEALLVILNDILDYSRLEAGALGLEAAPFATRSVVDGVVDIVRPLAEAKGLTLNVDVSNATPEYVTGDAGRLRQVFLNILSNAVKFTEVGHVTVRVNCVARDDTTAILEWSVEDTGIGIELDQIDGLFREFAQADNSIHRRFGGSGLGLAICKRLIEQMNGRIHVNSAPSRGTTMIFSVPLLVAERPSIPDRSGEADATALRNGIARIGGRLRLLLVDDNQTNHVVTARMLRDFDVEIDAAFDGIEAVAMTARKAYHVVLMDMRMPKMDGIDATKTIRARAVRGTAAQPKIIAFTANAMREDMEACAAAGMEGFIVKPIRRSDLLGSIAQVLDDPSPATATKVGASSPRGTKPVFDRETYFGLTSEVGEACAAEITQLFVEETSRQLADLRERAMANDTDGAGRLAHAIKGAAATFGLQQLAHTASLLERAPPESRAALDELVADMQWAFEAGLREIPAELKGAA